MSGGKSPGRKSRYNFYLPNWACVELLLVQSATKVSLKKFDRRTGILVGLLIYSLLKRVGKDSRGASSEQGGEGKELHNCGLRFEV